jgi:hypothetical protein
MLIVADVFAVQVTRNTPQAKNVASSCLVKRSPHVKICPENFPNLIQNEV